MALSPDVRFLLHHELGHSHAGSMLAGQPLQMNSP